MYYSVRLQMKDAADGSLMWLEMKRENIYF
jgi:hypothetical protein